MEDWQGCLAPQCQNALQRARDSIARRGGYAITVEDFLLALLDAEPAIAGFLRGRGVDLDELVRTVQCEQPIVTEVGGEGLLSAQLQYWFARARELSEAPWLDWPFLLRVLVAGAERFQGKAYVAVLEQVAQWPEIAESGGTAPDPDLPGESPIVITDSTWLGLAEDVSVTLSAVADSLVWVRGARGSGKSSWLQALLPSLDIGFLVLDLRREDEVMACDRPVFPGEACERQRYPVLVLDNTTPADLAALMSRDSHLASHLLPGHQGPILLLGPDGPEQGAAGRHLERLLGRTLEVVNMPGSSAGQNLAILTAHQAAIEKRWNVELTGTAIGYAAGARRPFGGSPGLMLRWVERAAARLSLYASRGSLAGQAVAGKVDTLRRQTLVAMARQHPLADYEQALEQLAIERAAAEVDWHERKAAGTLRRLTVNDLRYELERFESGAEGPGTAVPTLEVVC